MSAVFGLFSFTKEAISNEQLQLMERTYRERYAFDRMDSIVIHNRVGFGCMQQWVTPESRDERLPMKRQDADVWLTADAIIDNREEVASKLGMDPMTLSKRTDADLIMAAYLKWGEALVDHLIGNFAFAIYDGRTDELFLVRDHIGMRLMTYSIHHEQIYFATTVSPIQAVVQADVTTQVVEQYLLGGLPHRDARPFDTFFENIQYVPPAHVLRVRRGEIRLRSYWSFEQPDQLLRASDEAVEQQFRQVMDEATRACLRTFGTTGIMLSGGLDSSTVAALAAQMLHANQQPLLSYTHVPLSTYQSEKSELSNEQPLVEDLVGMYPNIQPTWVENPEWNALNTIDDWLPILDQPYVFAGNAPWILRCHQLGQAAGHRVMLSGKHGNGSISFGPLRTRYPYLWKQRRILTLLNEVYYQRKTRGISWIQATRLVAGNTFVSKIGEVVFDQWLPGLQSLFSAKLIEQINRSGFSEEANESSFDYLRMINIPKKTHPTGGFLTIISLQFGAVTRDPTADLRVLRFIASLPDEQFVSKGVHKRLLRRTYAKQLPESIIRLTRQKGTQSADWMHRLKGEAIRNELREAFRVSCQNEIIRGYLREDVLRSVDDWYERSIDDSEKVKLMLRCVILDRFLRSLGEK